MDVPNSQLLNRLLSLPTMTRVGLISDTHSYLDDAIFNYFKDCDEVWHAGDFGNAELIQRLQAFKPLKGVYGMK